MSMYTGNPELDRELGKALHAMQGLEELQRRLAELRTEGVAADGLVRVEVGPTGNLTGVTLHPRAMRMDSQSLAEALLEASRDATARAAEATNEAVGDLVAGDSGFADLMTGQGGLKMPAPQGGQTDDPLTAMRELLDDLRRGSG